MEEEMVDEFVADELGVVRCEKILLFNPPFAYRHPAS
jgi:hypothetical protein